MFLQRFAPKVVKGKDANWTGIPFATLLVAFCFEFSIPFFADPFAF